VNAARVKRFGFGSTSGRQRYTFDPLFYISLLWAAQGMKLLPRVQEISWDPQDDTVYVFIITLLSHTTRNLMLYFQDDPHLSDHDQARPDRTRVTLLPQIINLSPHLTQLSLIHVGGTPTDFAEAFSTPQLWSSLQCLRLDGFPEHSLAMACKIPNLRELFFHCRSSPSEILPLPRFCSGFSQLTKLTIWGCSIESVITLTKIIHNAPLRSFEVKCADHGVPLLNGTQDEMADSSLGDILHKPKTRPLTLEDMSGLSTFTNLTKLSLEVMTGFDLDDEQIKTIAKTLPHLEMLYFYSPNPPIDSPQMSFEGLKSVAQHCPKLKDLMMTFDASSITKHPNHGDICNVNTRTIDIRYSPIDDPVAVSAYLSATFPNLYRVCCPSTFDSHSEHELDGLKELASKWKEVNELLHKYKKVATFTDSV
jgi:hypothetical protein